jgi:hypothetical protein
MTTILHLAVLLASGLAGLNESVPAMRTDEIVSRMIEMDAMRRAALQSYISVRRYTVDNKRFNKHAEMTVRMKYTFPGTKSYEVISQSGSGVIRKRALKGIIDAEVEASKEANGERSRIIPQNYAFVLLGSEVVGGRPCYLLQIMPKTENKFLIKGRIWVDSEDFAIVRVVGSPAKSPSFWTKDTQVEHSYEKYGQFWLPRFNLSGSNIRIFGHTDLRIDYFEYEYEGREQANASAESVAVAVTN